MKKPERDWFIRAADNVALELTEERRNQLARKGQLLYGKYCGLHGKGICAESFAEYHVVRGEYVIVTDFLAFLHCVLKTEVDPGNVQITEQLIERIESMLY